MATPREIESRVADLERRLAALSGPMLSQQLGATVLRPYQVGLPVELTGGYSSATGYPWKACVLDTTLSSNQVKTDSALPTGKFAYTPDNDTSLTGGTRGWLEPDPQARGFLFVRGGSGSAAADDDSWKLVVRAASTANVTVSSPGSAFDGVTYSAGDTTRNKRLLLKNQSSAAENGLYDWTGATSALTRCPDAAATDDLVGAVVWVSEGSANADTIWACTTNKTWTPGVTASAWVKIYPDPNAALASNLGFFARLTGTPSGGLWSWQALTLSGGVEADDAGVTGTHNARQMTVDGSNTLTPVAGMRVWMKPSKSAGQYEFITEWAVMDGISSWPYSSIVSAGAYTDTGSLVFNVFGGNDGTSTASTHPGRISANAELRLAKLADANATGGSLYWGVTYSSGDVIPTFKDHAGEPWQCAIPLSGAGAVSPSDGAILRFGGPSGGDSGEWKPFQWTDAGDIIISTDGVPFALGGTAHGWNIASGAAIDFTSSGTRWYAIRVAGTGTACTSVSVEQIPEYPGANGTLVAGGHTLTFTNGLCTSFV